MVSMAEFLGEIGLSVASCSVQACALIGLILLAQFALRNRLSPRWRHALWLILLVKLALPWTPESRWSMYNLVPSFSREARSVESGLPLVASSLEVQGDVAPLEPTLREVVVAETENPSPVREVEAENRGQVVPSTALYKTPAPRRAFSFPLKQALAMVWFVGALFLLGSAVAQSVALGAAVRRRRSLTDQATLDLLEGCKEEMGVRAYLAVVETPRVKSPALFGFVRPRLLLPEGAVAALGPERLRHVFLHELAHLKRGDISVDCLMVFLQALHWFNPLVWYAFSRMRFEREVAADAQVLKRSRGSEAREYGRTIVHLLEEFSRPDRLPNLAGILEERNQMKRRITMITKFGTSSPRWSALALVLAILLGTVSLTSARSPQTDRKEAIDARTQAKEFVDLLAKNDYASAAALLDGKMRRKMTRKKLKGMWGDLLDRGGPFERVSGFRLERMLADHIVHVTCEFEKGPMDLKITLDSERKIADLSFGPTPLDLDAARGAGSERPVSPIGPYPGPNGPDPGPMLPADEGRGFFIGDRILRARPSVSDFFNDLDPPLPIKAAEYSVQAVKVRGAVKIIEQPSKKNDYSLTVEFDDGPIGGDDLYHARILDADGKQLYDVTIQLDGRSRLVFKENTARWVHLEWRAPGQHYGQDLPTTINGKQWHPKFAPQERTLRAYQSVSDFFNDLDPPLPIKAAEYSVQVVKVRGSVKIIEQPSKKNDYSLTVEFDDAPIGGDDLYHARILDADGKQLYDVTIQLDGRSRLVFKGNTARWVHLEWQAPGQHYGLNLPTTINGKKWYPDFTP